MSLTAVTQLPTARLIEFVRLFGDRTWVVEINVYTPMNLQRVVAEAPAWKISYFKTECYVTSEELLPFLETNRPDFDITDPDKARIELTSAKSHIGQHAIATLTRYKLVYTGEAPSAEQVSALQSLGASVTIEPKNI